MQQRTSGNALIITLFAVMILTVLLAAQVVVTRANVVTVERRTTNAMLSATATLHTPTQLRLIAADLPSFLGTQLAGTTSGSLGSAATLTTWQQNLDSTWAQCNTSSMTTLVHLAGLPSCSTADPGAAQRSAVTVNTLSGTGLTEYRVPLYVQITAEDASGSRRTRQATGEAVILEMASMPVTAYEILAGQVQGEIPAGMLTDGPVHVNGALPLAAGQSAFLGRVTSAAASLTLGGQVRTPQQFTPGPGVPCDPRLTTCPSFAGGLGLQTGAVPVPAAEPAPVAALTLPGVVREVVLAPHPSGGTEVFACMVVSCTRSWFQPTGPGRATLWQHALPSPVPPRNGLLFTPPEPTSGSAWSVSATGVAPVIFAPNDLSVRALYPTGSAYQGALTVAANQTLTVTSSLKAQTPVCDSYPVRDANGAHRPATCTAATDDQLGLVSVQGNIDLGDSSQPLAESETSMAVHAAMLASRGTVALRDTRLATLDLTGSVAAAVFAPDDRMRLAFDPRVTRPPAFPTMSSSSMPPAVILQQDSELDLP